MVWEAHNIRRLEELKGRTLEELLQEVSRSGKLIIVILAEGESVNIELAPRLKPLPRLDGSVPEGWKDAVY